MTSTASWSGAKLGIDGIIRSGAKMINAMSNSIIVPKITVLLGGSFGAGHYRALWKSLWPTFHFRMANCALRRDGR